MSLLVIDDIVNAMDKKQIVAKVHIDLSKTYTAYSIQPYIVNKRIWLLPTKLFCGLEFTLPSQNQLL